MKSSLQKSDRRYKSRTSRAASSLELVCGLLMLVPVCLVLFDLGTILVAVFSNDSVCREACRAASATDPKDAKKIAEQIVNRANSGGSKITLYKLVEEPKTTSMKVPPPDQGGLVEGSVTLKTEVDVTPMFLVGAMYGGKPIPFICEQTFPYTFVMQPKRPEQKPEEPAEEEEES